MSGRIGTLRQSGLRATHVPGDEFAQDAGPFPVPDQLAELCPVGIGHANDTVRGVGVLCAADHALRVRGAYAPCLAVALTVHMHTDNIVHMHDASLSGISSCRHKNYGMTCEQFADLLERSQARCEICRRPGIETSHGQLYIDHDIRRGMWAVRGLLCGRCNSLLEHEKEFTPEVRPYLEASWWRSMLASLGVDEWPAEPPPRSTVYVGQACQWRRYAKGWACKCVRHRHRGGRKTWPQLISHLGPHRLRLPNQTTTSSK